MRVRVDYHIILDTDDYVVLDDPKHLDQKVLDFLHVLLLSKGDLWNNSTDMLVSKLMFPINSPSRYRKVLPINSWNLKSGG